MIYLKVELDIKIVQMPMMDFFNGDIKDEAIYSIKINQFLVDALFRRFKRVNCYSRKDDFESVIDNVNSFILTSR